MLMTTQGVFWELWKKETASIMFKLLITTRGVSWELWKIRSIMLITQEGHFRELPETAVLCFNYLIE